MVLQIKLRGQRAYILIGCCNQVDGRRVGVGGWMESGGGGGGLLIVTPKLTMAAL